MEAEKEGDRMKGGDREGRGQRRTGWGEGGERKKVEIEAGMGIKERRR